MKTIVLTIVLSFSMLCHAQTHIDSFERQSQDLIFVLDSNNLNISFVVYRFTDDELFIKYKHVYGFTEYHTQDDATNSSGISNAIDRGMLLKNFLVVAFYDDDQPENCPAHQRGSFAVNMDTAFSQKVQSGFLKGQFLFNTIVNFPKSWNGHVYKKAVETLSLIEQ